MASSMICHFGHSRSVIAPLLGALLFFFILAGYNLVTTHHQTLVITQTDNQSLVSNMSHVTRKHSLIQTLNGDYEEHEETPYAQNRVVDPNDLHRCRVKVILSELDHLYQKEDLISQCSRVIYNRVPKCGSRAVLRTFRTLSTKLNYSLVSIERPSRGRSYFTGPNILSFVQNFTDFEPPVLYSQHLHYVDFTKYHHENPLYVNVIRDPAERQISHFYYHQFGSSNNPKSTKEITTIDSCMESGTGFCLRLNEMLPFFCGQEKMCRTRNAASLAKAKRVASSSVLVLGFTEDLPSFMEVLEFVLPNYFANASEVFNDMSVEAYNRTKTAYKPSVKPSTKEKLRDHLSLEYDFYHFAKQRFYKLLARVRRVKANLNPGYENKKKFLKWWIKSEKEQS